MIKDGLFAVSHERHFFTMNTRRVMRFLNLCLAGKDFVEDIKNEATYLFYRCTGRTRFVGSWIRNAYRSVVPMKPRNTEVDFLQEYYVNMNALDEQKDELHFMDFENRLNTGFTALSVLSCGYTFYRAYEQASSLGAASSSDDVGGDGSIGSNLVTL